MNQKWEIGPVKLVNGWDAVIHRFCENRQKYIGDVKDCDGWFHAAEWSVDGKWNNPRNHYDSVLLDLAPPPKKKVRLHGWLNVYPNGTASFWSHKNIADSSKARFACIEIDREVEEGEGLNPNVRSDAENVRSRNP